MYELVKKVIDDIRRTGLEMVANRFYGIYMCEVVNNQDPKNNGRIKVRGRVFGKVNETDFWIPPKSLYAGNSYGIFFPPERGDRVFIMFIDGDHGRPYYDGGYWISEQTPFKDIQTKIPTVRGIQTKTGFKIVFAEENTENDDKYFEIYTPKGQYVKFDDKDDSESYEVLDKEGNRFFSNSDGITIEDKFGNSYISTENGIIISDVNDNVITKNSNGITIDVSGDCVVNTVGNCDINASGSCTIKSPNVTITGGQATINGSVAPTGNGALCGIPVCVFSGAPHVGPTSNGT